MIEKQKRRSKEEEQSEKRGLKVMKAKMTR